MSDPLTCWDADNQWAAKAREMASARIETEQAKVYFQLGYMAGTIDGIADVEKVMDERLKKMPNR